MKLNNGKELLLEVNGGSYQKGNINNATKWRYDIIHPSNSKNDV